MNPTSQTIQKPLDNHNPQSCYANDTTQPAEPNRKNTPNPPNNRVIEGDCVTVLNELPGACIDLVVTDPPYLTRYQDRSGRTVINDNDDHWVRPAFQEIHRVLKPNTFCISFYGWNHIEKFMLAWKDAGFRPVGHIVWHKRYASKTGYLGARHEQA